jgi:hypothetical protein
MQMTLATTYTFYKSHKAAIMAYLCYLLFWWCSLGTKLKYEAAVDHISKDERVAWGEGVMYWYLITLAISVGTTIVMLLNVILNKETRIFYLVMSILIYYAFDNLSLHIRIIKFKKALTLLPPAHQPL